VHNHETRPAAAGQARRRAEAGRAFREARAAASAVSAASIGALAFDRPIGVVVDTAFHAVHEVPGLASACGPDVPHATHPPHPVS
jgi:hypothetical protein